jgi:hypothetical protein
VKAAIVIIRIFESLALPVMFLNFGKRARAGAEVDEPGGSIAHESCVLIKLLLRLLHCRNKLDFGGL